MGIHSLGQAVALSGLAIGLSLLPFGRSQATVPSRLAAVPQTFPQLQAFPQPGNLAARPTIPPLPLIVPPRPVSTERTIVTVTCDVLPREGLVVRRQPNLDSAAASVLTPGTYDLRFTGVTETIGRRRLAYIAAPVQGWIEVLTQGGVSTLGGESCG